MHQFTVYFKFSVVNFLISTATCKVSSQHTCQADSISFYVQPTKNKHHCFLVKCTDIGSFADILATYKCQKNNKYTVLLMHITAHVVKSTCLYVVGWCSYISVDTFRFIWFVFELMPSCVHHIYQHLQTKSGTNSHRGTQSLDVNECCWIVRKETGELKTGAKSSLSDREDTVKCNLSTISVYQISQRVTFVSRLPQLPSEIQKMHCGQ